jgi:hypothetical protein
MNPDELLLKFIVMTERLFDVEKGREHRPELKLVYGQLEELMVKAQAYYTNGR